MPTEAELLEANFEPIDLDKFFEPIDESYEGQLKHLGITPERERQAKGTALRAELAFEQGDQLAKEARRQAVADYNRQQDNALSRTEAVRGVTRGTLQMGEGFSGAAETVAKLFGGPDAGETPKALGDYFAARAKAIPSAVPSLRNVEDVGTFTEFGAKALGELFPQIVTSMIPAAGAAKLGKVVGLGKKGIAALTGAGAAVSSIPQEIGGMFREIRDTTGKEEPLIALGFGIPAGLLDAVTPSRLVGKVLGATSKEAKKLAWREVVRNAVKEIPKSAATEGLTEPVQEGLAIAANKTADSSYDAVNEENFWRLLDAAAMGAIGGGVFGGGTTVGATALNKVSRNQEALRLKNLRRGRDDARSRLVVEQTPEVPLPPEFITLQQNIDEQQRAKAAQEVQEPATVIPAIPKTEEAGAATATVPGLGVQGVVETPKAPRGVAPVTFLEDQSHLIPGLVWYQIQEDITSPDGGVYPKGRNITSGELLRFGYTLPPTQVSGGTRPTESGARIETEGTTKGGEETRQETKEATPKQTPVAQSAAGVVKTKRPPDILDDIEAHIGRPLSVTVQDGPRYGVRRIGADEIVNVQPGSLKQTAPSTEFLSPGQASQSQLTRVRQAPEPTHFDSIEDLLRFRKIRLAEERELYKEQIGITEEQALTLQNRLKQIDSSTSRFEKTLSPKQLRRFNEFFDGPFNQRDGPFKLWEHDSRLDPDEIANETDADLLGSALISAVERGIEEQTNNDRFISAVIAARRLQELRKTKSDIARSLDRYTTRQASSQGDKEEFFRSLGNKVNAFLLRQGITLPEGELGKVPRLRQMENQGDLLATQTEPFALTQERGTDVEAQQRAQVAREQARLESAKDQLGLPIAPPTPVVKESLTTQPTVPAIPVRQESERLRIPAINKGTRETTDLSAFAIPLPTDVLLVDAQGNSPTQEQVRLKYRTSGKNPGLRLYVDNRPAYEITLPAGTVTKDATGISVDPTALMDTANWKRVGKTPERSPFTLERDSKKKPVAQQRAAEEATDEKGDLLPLALVPGSPVAQNYEYNEARVVNTHNAPPELKAPQALVDMIDADPSLVASVNSNDPSAAIAAARELIEANATKTGQLLDDFLAQRLAEQVIKEIQENKDMLSVSPGARLVPMRVIASGKGKAEIAGLLANGQLMLPLGEGSQINAVQGRQSSSGIPQRLLGDRGTDTSGTTAATGDQPARQLQSASPAFAQRIAQLQAERDALIQRYQQSPGSPLGLSARAQARYIDGQLDLLRSGSLLSEERIVSLQTERASLTQTFQQNPRGDIGQGALAQARYIDGQLDLHAQLLSMEQLFVGENAGSNAAMFQLGLALVEALPSQYTDGLTLQIVARQEQGGSRVTQSGSFSAATSIATILQNATDENTALHEASHWLEGFLNPVERARNNQLWRQELDRELATATDARRELLQSIKDSDGMTSLEYLTQAQGDTSVYHLSNPSEFFAYRFTNQARAELQRDNAIDYVRNLLKRILEAVKRLVGRGDFYDAVWRKFMAGEFSVDARSGPLFERNKYGVAASLEPIASRDAYQSFMRGSQTATPDINRFKQTVSWFQNESVVGRITNSFAALPRGVKSELDFLRGRIVAMADALADLGTAPNVTGNVVARAQALSPDPVEQNQLVFSVVNGTMEVEHAARNLEQRAIELDKELRLAQAKDTKDSAFADLANDILSKAVPAQRTLLRQSNLTVFLEGGTIGAAETAQAVAATSSYANLVAKVADANNGISRKQRILEYQLNNVNQARQYLASQVLSDPRTQQDYRDGIAARGVRAVVLSEVGGTVTYEDPLAPNDRSKDVTVSFSLDATEVLANQQKFLDIAAKMDQYLQTGTDELRKAAYVDELDRIWNYHLSTRNFPSTGKLLFGKGDVFRWLTFGGRVAIPDYITKFIGGEPARKLSIALKNYSEARQQAMNHQDRLRQNIYTSIYRAAKAHKMNRGEWMRKVGKPILDSHAAFGAVRPIKTGMKLAGNIVVLRSDMEAIEAQATFFRIVAGAVGEMSNKLSSAQPSPVLIYEQATAKRPAYERKPLQASRFMLPRMIGRQWRNLAARWLVTQKAGNTAALVDMVNDPAHWQGFLSHLRAYEDPSYVIKSDFVQAYRMVQEDIYNGNVPADFDGLVTMVDLELGGTVPRADIEEKMLGEFTGIMRLLNNPVTPSQVDVSIISGENFMNNPRGQSIAPPGMYEIGLNTEGSQFSLISQVAEVYGQRYLNALQGVKEALEKKAVEYKGKEKSGITRKQVEKESREAQLAGDTFVNYQELLTLQKQVFHQLQQFRELAQSKQGFDVEMSRGLRLLGNITGALLQTPGVLFRNSLGGPIRAVAIDAAIGYSTSIFGVRLPVISTALNTSKNALLFARGARQLALGMISNRLARTAVGRAARRTLQNNPTFWNSTAQWLASVMNKNAQAYQTADDLGLLKEAPIKEQIGNYFRLFSEGGRIVGDDPKAMQKLIRSAESIVGILFELGIPIANFPRKVLPALIDDALNVVSDTFAAHVTESVSKNALKSLTARASLNARTDELTPQEILGRSGATAKQLEWLRLLFDQNNISLDRALIEYYQNVEAAKAAGQNPNAVQFLTPQQYDSLRLTFANELNRAGFMNRPALFAKSAFARAFGTFFGYPAQTNTQFSVFLSKHSRDTRTLAGREGFLLVMQLMLMIVLFGTLLAAPGADLLHRIFYNRERQIPQLSSAKDGWDLARIAFMQSGALMPTVGGVFNYMIEQTKPGMGMGGSGVNLLPLSLFNGTMEAFRAAYQTGDVIRPAVSFVRRWLPNSQIVLNRTPFMEGSIEGGNVRAILDRNAPTSIERRGFGFGGNIKRSSTSDDIDGIVNAIYRGDSSTAKRLTDKAVEERRASGIAKPENSVYSSVLSRNPYNSLFGKTLTEGERALVFSRLKPQDRARVTKAEDAFQSYAQSSGRNEPTFVSSRGTTPRRSSRSRTRSYRSRSRRFSIRSRNRFRIRGLGRRRNRRLLRV